MNILDELVGHSIELAGFEDGTLQFNMDDGKIWLFTIEVTKKGNSRIRIEVYDHEMQ